MWDGTWKQRTTFRMPSSPTRTSPKDGSSVTLQVICHLGTFGTWYVLGIFARKLQTRANRIIDIHPCISWGHTWSAVSTKKIKGMSRTEKNWSLGFGIWHIPRKSSKTPSLPMIWTCGQACSSRVPSPSSRTQQFGVCTGDVGTLQPTREYSAGPAGLASCRTGHYPGSACALVLAQCCSAVELGRRAICSLTGGGGDLIGWASYLGKICGKNCYGAAYYWVYKTIWIYILYGLLYKPRPWLLGNASGSMTPRRRPWKRWPGPKMPGGYQQWAGKDLSSTDIRYQQFFSNLYYVWR